MDRLRLSERTSNSGHLRASSYRRLDRVCALPNDNNPIGRGELWRECLFERRQNSLPGHPIQELLSRSHKIGVSKLGTLQRDLLKQRFGISPGEQS